MAFPLGTNLKVTLHNFGEGVFGSPDIEFEHAPQRLHMGRQVGDDPDRSPPRQFRQNHLAGHKLKLFRVRWQPIHESAPTCILSIPSIGDPIAAQCARN